LATGELETMGFLRKVYDQARARRAMFQAAVAIVHRGGPARPKEFEDPFGAGPFKYRALPKGFELLSKLTEHQHKHVTLTVGARK
jgi:hypothetical protein